MAEEKEWYTLQEIADSLGVLLYKVRYAVTSLRATGMITARDRPTDKRIIEVHRDSLGTLRQAILGA